MICSSASARIGPTLAGKISARRSNAVSMIASSACAAVAVWSAIYKFHDTSGGVDAVSHRRHERNPHVSAAWILAVRVPGQIAARQHGDVLGSIELAGKRLLVTAGHSGPVVEARARLRECQRRFQNRTDRRKLFPIPGAIVAHMRLVTPRRDAGMLHGEAHRTSMICAIEQETRQERGVAGHAARA